MGILRRQHRRLTIAFAFVLLLATGGISVFSGCAMHITPPRDVAEPAKIYLADYGRHSSVLLPEDDKTLVEFTYGQWHWFALNKNAWYNAWYLSIFPASGTLGRRVVPNDMSDEEMKSELAALEVYSLNVERSRAIALRDELQRMYDANIDTKVNNSLVGMDFVRAPIIYSLYFQNCNKVVAVWLERMGCHVGGSHHFADFKIKQQQNRL